MPPNAEGEEDQADEAFGSDAPTAVAAERKVPNLRGESGCGVPGVKAPRTVGALALASLGLTAA